MNTQQFLLFSDIAFRVIGVLTIITFGVVVLHRFYAKLRARVNYLSKRLDQIEEELYEIDKRLHIRIDDIKLTTKRKHG